MFDMLDKLGDDFSNHAFGSNKQGDLFIDGQKTTINFSRLEDFGISEDMLNEKYKQLKSFIVTNFPMHLEGVEFKDALLKSKFVKVEKE